jgi:uncharacterized repeat protein (TIGR01451 family)
VSIADTPDPTTLGTSVSYTVTVRNSGPAHAFGVTLVDTLPVGTTLLSKATSSKSDKCVSAGQQVTCVIGRIKGGDESSVMIQVRADQAGTMIDSAWASAGTVDPNQANNSARATTTVMAGSTAGATAFAQPNPFVPEWLS